MGFEAPPNSGRAAPCVRPGSLHAPERAALLLSPFSFSSAVLSDCAAPVSLPPSFARSAPASCSCTSFLRASADLLRSTHPRLPLLRPRRKARAVPSHGHPNRCALRGDALRRHRRLLRWYGRYRGPTAPYACGLHLPRQALRRARPEGPRQSTRAPGRAPATLTLRRLLHSSRGPPPVWLCR